MNLTLSNNDLDQIAEAVYMKMAPHIGAPVAEDPDELLEVAEVAKQYYRNHAWILQQMRKKHIELVMNGKVAMIRRKHIPKVFQK